MIGFLKRWFVTKNEIESVYSQLDTIAHAIQDIRKDQWIRAEAERGAIVKQPSEVVMSFERVDNLKPRKLPAKQVVDEEPEATAKSSSSEHFARMSVRTKGTIENRLVDIANDRMRGIGCADVYALKRRINEGTASLCISGNTRCVKRSKKSKQTRTYAGDMRFYDKRTVNTKGNYPEKTYSFRCDEERLLLMAYFDIHRVPYTTGRKQ